MKTRFAAHILAITVLIAACSAPTPTPSAPPDPTPVATSSSVVLAIDSLPNARFDPPTTLVVCDFDPIQADSDAGETTISCTDGALLAMRALAGAQITDIDRLYLQRRPCGAGPCSRNVLDTALVTAWFGPESATVALDSRSQQVVVATDVPPTEWPSAGSSEAPSAPPIVMADAPEPLLSRDPLPSCGAVDIAVAPAGVPEACFFGAVLRGSTAELLEKVYSTEGDPITLLYRYEGTGAIIRYRTDEAGGWDVEAGGLILDPGGTSFSFDVWPETITRI